MRDQHRQTADSALLPTWRSSMCVVASSSHQKVACNALSFSAVASASEGHSPPHNHMHGACQFALPPICPWTCLTMLSCPPTEEAACDAAGAAVAAVSIYCLCPPAPHAAPGKRHHPPVSCEHTFLHTFRHTLHTFILHAFKHITAPKQTACSSPLHDSRPADAGFPPCLHCMPVPGSASLLSIIPPSERCVVPKALAHRHVTSYRPPETSMMTSMAVSEPPSTVSFPWPVKALPTRPSPGSAWRYAMQEVRQKLMELHVYAVLGRWLMHTCQAASSAGSQSDSSTARIVLATALDSLPCTHAARGWAKDTGFDRFLHLSEAAAGLPAAASLKVGAGPRSVKLCIAPDFQKRNLSHLSDGA